jgi:hypothetical protein
MMHIQILNLSEVYKLIVENNDDDESIDNFNTMDQIRSAYINEIYKNHDYIITNIGELCEDLIIYLTEKNLY